MRPKGRMLCSLSKDSHVKVRQRERQRETETERESKREKVREREGERRRDMDDVLQRMQASRCLLERRRLLVGGARNLPVPPRGLHEVRSQSTDATRLGRGAPAPGGQGRLVGVG